MEFFKKLHHKGVVYGVMWCPLNKYILATGCQDSLVRVYDVQKGDNPIKVFKGHKGPIFNVVWHPQFDYVLASGSDDSTIRIWDTQTVR